MHIARVEVRQYRGLQGLELDLAPGGRPGLVVVEGPNEAGKSTLLGFMRALLFPEPRSASDAAELVSGSLTLQDGDKRYRIERDGPRATSRLTDLTTGELLDLPRLSALLGNLDATVYRNVFAFGLSELQAFDALGNEAVKERLYSAAVAGAGRSASEAAGKLADRSPEVNAVLEHHEELAETTRLVFTVLTAVFAALVLAPVALKREPGEVATIGVAVLFLAVYGAGTLVLANTAHNGGRLVHELGVRALMPSAPLPAAEAEKD